MMSEPATRETVRAHILFTVGVLAALALAAFLLGALADVWLLAFGGILLAVALHGAGARLERHVPFLSGTLATGLVCTVFFALAGAALWSLGPAFADGLVGLREDLPKALDRGREFLASRPELSKLLAEASEKASELSPDADMLGRLGGVLFGLVGALAGLGGALVGVFVICVVAIYGALQPSSYTDAVIAVLPARHERRAREVLAALAEALRWWLVGRASSMLVVGVLTWLGLLALGVPSAGTLGTLSALLSFVPNIGPIVAAVPAILIGLGESPTTALYVIALYVLVQTVESYVVTPLIQQRVVALPPASVIVVQLAFGTALGLLGLLFATPLAVVAMVLVRMLWIEDVLDERTDELHD